MIEVGDRSKDRVCTLRPLINSRVENLSLVRPKLKTEMVSDRLPLLYSINGGDSETGEPRFYPD